MKNILAITFFLLIIKSTAQVKVTNKSNSPILFCIAYRIYPLNANKFISKGWWEIIPGETQVIEGYEIQYGENSFYYFAQNESGKWKGQQKFVISDDKFEIVDADKIYLHEEMTKYRFEGFRQKSFNIGLHDSLSYELKLED
jgi:uncharacterized membrane protein